jgi:hypothetical protein
VPYLCNFILQKQCNADTISDHVES